MKLKPAKCGSIGWASPPGLTRPISSHGLLFDTSSSSDLVMVPACRTSLLAPWVIEKNTRIVHDRDESEVVSLVRLLLALPRQDLWFKVFWPQNMRPQIAARGA